MFRASSSGAGMKKPMIRFIQVGGILYDWGEGRTGGKESGGKSILVRI